MRASRVAAPAVAALLLAPGCQKDATAPWLTMPSVASHAVYFPIGPADVHGAAPGQSPDCDGCHFDKGTGQPSSTFRTFTCTNGASCHVALRPGYSHDLPADLVALHVAAPEYAATVALYEPSVASLNGGVGPQSPEDGACRSSACHPNGWAVDHAGVFPLPHRNGSGTQVAICSDCHRDLADRRRLGCAVCHPHDQLATTTAHAKVPDFAAASANDPPATIEGASALCVRCHGDGIVAVTVAGHGAGTIGFLLGTGAHAGTAGGSCFDCHPQNRAAPKTFAADFSKFTCATPCHGAVPVTIAGPHDDATALGTYHSNIGVDFAGQVAALGFDDACRSCHPDGSGGLPANHPFPVGASPKHPPGTACATCHTSTTIRDNPAYFACYGCHIVDDPSLATKHSSPTIPVSDYDTAPAKCLYCHGDSQVNRAASHPGGDGTPLRNDPKHKTAGCARCHRIARTDKPFAADWSRTNCSGTGCHGSAGGPD